MRMQRAHRRRVWGLGVAATVALCAGLGTVALAAGVSPKVVVEPRVLKGRQGDVVTLTVALPASNLTPSGQLAGQDIPFFRLDDSGRFGALVGIDIDAPAGKHTLTVTVGDRTVAKVPVVIAAQHFPTQTLTVPDAMVHLDEAALTRVKQEQQEVLTAMAPVTAERRWAGPFLLPTDGPLMGSFGKRRIINGEPRNPHSGEDFAAPEGAQVIAANDGVVCLIGDHFFSGHSVFIDHGDGLYTMYFHLSKVLVEPTQRVRKGDVIGLVGASGRATGPHLHWGARLNGARINPIELTHLAFK